MMTMVTQEMEELLESTLAGVLFLSRIFDVSCRRQLVLVGSFLRYARPVDSTCSPL